mgnify:CR=1 FL=1
MYIKAGFSFFRQIYTLAHEASERVRESCAAPSELRDGADYSLSYPDHLSGYCVDGGELRAVFSLVPGRGTILVKDAVFRGAERLDCFDGYLVQLYRRLGFTETARATNWTPGQPDVVYMALAHAEPDYAAGHV